MSFPEIRREDDMLIGRSSSRVLRSRLRHLRSRIVCLLRGHDFNSWRIDDYDGPGELMEPDDPESFMPYLSRDSRRGEFGTRICRRRCGTHESRWPEADAPERWRTAV